jgi:hypothetical protein
VFTYGLLAPELARTGQADQRLLDRIGGSWLASFAVARSLGEGELDPLTRLYRDLGALPPNGWPAAWMLDSTEGRDLDRLRLDANLLAAFTASPGWRRLREFVGHDLRTLVDDIEEAADAGRPPSAELADFAADLLARYAPPARPWRLRLGEPANVVWGLRCDTLDGRIALELFELYTHRPTLRRCRYCAAVYVPRVREANCSWWLWDAETLEMVRACTDPDNFDRDEHRRTRKKLHARLARARKRHGADENHPHVIRARDELNEYMETHERRRGPSPRPLGPGARPTAD